MIYCDPFSNATQLLPGNLNKYCIIKPISNLVAVWSQCDVCVHHHNKMVIQSV